MNARTPPHGRIDPLWVLLLVATAAISGLVILLRFGGPMVARSQRPGEAPPASKLSMYCAAGLRWPVEEIARQYEQEYKIRVEIQFGGSDTLLNQIEVNKFDTGDLYLAADDWYTDEAASEGSRRRRCRSPINGP